MVRYGRQLESKDQQSVLSNSSLVSCPYTHSDYGPNLPISTGRTEQLNRNNETGHQSQS
ncbi:hypothetical protein SynBIOSE41_02068 [Synechococcus sp. BIOS-E4-1]|nr:hypothetical protein SynBIOSE41_02068 [Synechococcus sp. BIOS-E4-1]